MSGMKSNYLIVINQTWRLCVLSLIWTKGFDNFSGIFFHFAEITKIMTMRGSSVTVDSYSTLRLPFGTDNLIMYYTFKLII
jgi:hypothetical protein